GTSQVPRRSILCLCPALRPRPNQRSLASLTVSSMLPPRFPRQELQRLMNFGALSRGFLPTLQDWCRHHPCKARFRLAGSPLPGGSRTLWIATKGFRSQSHPPFLDLSWRKGSFILNLPLASHHSITSSARPRSDAARASGEGTGCCRQDPSDRPCARPRTDPAAPLQISRQLRLISRTRHRRRRLQS